jgi:hypothetical protein
MRGQAADDLIGCGGRRIPVYIYMEQRSTWFGHRPTMRNIRLWNCDALLMPSQNTPKTDHGAHPSLMMIRALTHHFFFYKILRVEELLAALDRP